MALRLRELLDKAAVIHFHDGDEAVQAWYRELPESDREIITEHFLAVDQIAKQVYKVLRERSRELFLDSYRRVVVCFCGQANIPEEAMLNGGTQICTQCGEAISIAERLSTWLKSPITETNGQLTEEAHSALTVVHAN